MMQFGPLSLKRCRYGWMLYRGPVIGKCFDLYGQYSESEIALMRNFLSPGATVVDVGANIGDLTLPLSSIVGQEGRVYALESNPATYNVLCANLALNQVLNVKPINAFVATSDQVDTAGPWGKYAYIGTTWKPTFIAIDDLDVEACDLIKVDVDGNELEVLKSAEMRIEAYRPVLYFENDVRQASSKLLDFVLREIGYDAYWHVAPVFDECNYFDNPVNYWAPKIISSIMVLAVPRERKCDISGLRRVRDKDDWWEQA